MSKNIKENLDGPLEPKTVESKVTEPSEKDKQDKYPAEKHPSATAAAEKKAAQNVGENSEEGQQPLQDERLYTEREVNKNYENAFREGFYAAFEKMKNFFNGQGLDGEVRASLDKNRKNNGKTTTKLSAPEWGTAKKTNA